ncbi:AGE family epimerase/isomerase [Candidatus Latescibacterota bacterium]
MKRRSFLKSSAGSAAVLAGLSGCTGESKVTQQSISDDTLAGYTLTELRELYRYDLFDDYIPFVYKHVVDHELGGFMCNTDRDGTNITGNKRTWYEGRGIWVSSHLYNTLDPDPVHLEIARKSVEFIMNLEPPANELWPSEFTREGKPRGGPDTLFYGDMFVANGLQEYSKATGEDKWWDKSKEIILKCLDIYDNRPGYGNLRTIRDLPELERPRLIGHWFVLLRATTQMLEKRDDPELLAINERCIDAIMNYHYNPEYGLFNEYVNHDLSRIDNDYGQVVTGHGLETMWMVMFEALRRNDKALFDTAATRFKRSIEVFWDDVYGGMLAGLDHVDRNVWTVSKSLWLQEEILIATMCVYEHTGEQWAKDWFSKQYSYVRSTYPLKPHGYPIWQLSGDRKVTYVERATRVGNFHHPRHLMTNIQALDRMMGKA